MGRGTAQLVVPSTSECLRRFGGAFPRAAVVGASGKGARPSYGDSSEPFVTWRPGLVSQYHLRFSEQAIASASRPPASCRSIDLHRFCLIGSAALRAKDASSKRADHRRRRRRRRRRRYRIQWSGCLLNRIPLRISASFRARFQSCEAVISR